MEHGVFTEIVDMFVDRLAHRDVIGDVDVPETDVDIVDIASERGLQQDEIRKASIIARRRVSNYISIELIDIGAHEIAEQKKKHMSLN